MRIPKMILTGCLAGSMAAFPAFALTAGECVAGRPTAASYTWNFSKEATGLLQDVQAEAHNIQDHAATLKRFTRSTDLSWQSHADQLRQMKTEINDMGQKLCRLQVIRRVLPAWQQQAIDRIAPTVQLIADNAQDAITFLNNHQEALWQPTYRHYVNNLYQESSRLSNTTSEYVQYAQARSQYMALSNELGMKASS